MPDTIMVVDDEPIARQTLHDILKIEGFNVISFANGESAIEFVRNNSVDLILLDVKMPGMGGHEVVKVVTQISPDTQIILLTAFGSMESAVEALRQRVHDYIIKPESPTQIISSVRRGLEEREKRLADLQNEASPSLFYTLVDGTRIDLSRRKITKDGKEEFLTPAEGQLLKIFLENVGKVFTHREIVLLVQGYDVSSKEAQEILRPLVSRLRNKLVEFPAIFDRIVSIRGTGYVFEPQR